MRTLVATMMMTVALSPATAAPAHAAAPAGCGDATPAALAQYFDGAVPDLLKTNNVPGAAVSVVSGGTLAYAHGYGLADVERGLAFNPDTTLFRIASMTKLFTWTAVMQQVEAGRLDLDADVNQYLKTFQIPATYPKPVTLLTLMNHTAGFDDHIIGSGALKAADVPPLGEFLAARIPTRIYPPGEISAYSNYGAALAGYIVSQVTGEPYDLYVQHHIFDPLGIAHSTATEPVPAALAPDLAASYNSDSTPPKRVPFEFVKQGPDGSISASTNDLAKFAIAHLHEGGAILSPAITALMHERSFAADPRLGGYAHGFQDRTFNGHRVLMHDGGWEGFEGALLLVPDCDLGLVVATNATGGADVMTKLIPGFFDKFLPGTTVPAQGSVRAAPQAGFYAPTRHNESTIEKLLVLLGPMRLKLDSDGTIHFKSRAWSPRSDGLYTAADDSDHLVFLTGTHNQLYVATDVTTYQLLSRSQTLPFNLVLLGGVLVLALSALAIPLTGLRRRRPKTAPKWRLARWLACGALVLGITFLVLLLMMLLGDTSDYLYSAPLSFRLLLGVPIVVIVMAVGAAACTAWAWRTSGAGRFARGHQVALLLGLAALGWFLWQWNLIGWQI